jgi:hypothetical protein
VAWLGANLVGAAIISAWGYREDLADAPTGLFALVAVGGWSCMGAAVVWRARDDAAAVGWFDALVARPRLADLLGVPLGVATQLAVLPLVYLPLQAVWPDTFSDDALERTARRVVTAAEGSWFVVVVLVVVVGAPVVEEFVYRGMLQRWFSHAFGAVAGWLGASVLFALIHFRAVEYPGLFAAGLVFGACLWRTGRLPMAIAAHVAFNATGVLLVR